MNSNEHTCERAGEYSFGPEHGRRRSPAARVAIILAKIAVFGAVLYFVVAALAAQLSKISWGELKISSGYLAAAFGCVIIAWAIMPFAYMSLLRRLCRTMSKTDLVGGILVAQLGKYVPGKFGSVLGIVYYLRKHGVDTKSSLSSVVITDGLYVVVGLITALPMVMWGPYADVLPMARVWCPILMVVGLLCLHPRVFGGVMNFALRKLGMEPIQSLPRFRDYAAPMLALLLQFIVMGAGLWLMSNSLGEVSASLLPISISALALGNTLGFMVLFIPAGIGIQEIAILALFTPLVGPQAAMLAVGMRLARTTADIVLAAAGAILLAAVKSRRETKV